MMRVCIGNDHRGVKRKNAIVKYLESNGYEVINMGADSEESIDYPTIAFPLCKKIVDKEADLGILLCGTGIGMSIAANKVKGIRCAKVDNVHDAVLTKEHNNANVMALSSEISFRKTKKLIDAFLTTEFSNDERHVRRLKMIEDYND